MQGAAVDPAPRFRLGWIGGSVQPYGTVPDV